MDLNAYKRSDFPSVPRGTFAARAGTTNPPAPSGASVYARVEPPRVRGGLLGRPGADMACARVLCQLKSLVIA